MRKISIAIIILVNFLPMRLKAQTDLDAIMMEKNQLCIGPMYTYSSFKNYWEGSVKRGNTNMGTVLTQTYSVMANYGISAKLNLLFNVPYVQTNASVGSLHGMKGMQDLSLFLKWMPLEQQLGSGTISVYTIAGGSVPLSNYVADFMPLSIGLHSKTASARVIVDYQVSRFFLTGSATYVARDKIKIDRTAYYDNQLHLSNQVNIPDASNFNFRAGYRSSKLIAEAVLNKFTTLGGFDISRNNSPFPSNRINATTLGINFKLELTPKNNLSIVAGGNTTVAGRNTGQSRTYYGSVFYVLDFSHQLKTINKSGKTR